MAAVETKVKYGTSTSITISLGSLASSATAGREGTAIDNTTTRYIDVLLQGRIVLQAGTPGSDKAVYVYVYGSEDGTNYTDNATGSDANITLRAPTNLVIVGVIYCPDSGALTYEMNPVNVAAAFGGHIPRKWGIAVRNFTNVTFNATGGNHVFTYSGITYETA